MDWTSADTISLIESLKWPTVALLAVFVPGIYFREELRSFMKGLKQVDGKIGTDGVGIGLSSENKTHEEPAIPFESVKPVPKESLPIEDQVVEDDKKLSFNNILKQIKTEGILAARESFDEYAKENDADGKVSMLRAYFLTRLYFDGNYQGVFDEFKSLYEQYHDDESRYYIIVFWAECYTKINQHDKAQDVLRTGMSDISNQGYVSMLTQDLANSIHDSGDYNEAVATINKRISERDDRHELAGLYGTLSDIESAENNELMAALCLEKKAEFTPEDASVLFDAAYNLSRANVPALSLYYYNLLLGIDPKHQTALNNIGVIANELDLSIKAVEFQSQSSTLDESLAYANLGFSLLKAGFVDLAKEMAEKGLELDNPHNNNHVLMERINTRQKEQSEKWNEFCSKSGNPKAHLGEYTAAYYAPIDGVDCPFEGEWIDQNGNAFTVERDGTSLAARWEHTHKPISAASSTIGGLLGGGVGIMRVTTFDLSGSYVNGTAIISIMTTDSPPSMLSIGPDSYFRLFSYIDKDTGNWIIFNTDLIKPYETTFKREADK
jgi:tetratricopeptide (TPR) repeat protein